MFFDRPQANKIFACLWAEINLNVSHIIFLDSDSVFVSEPLELALFDGDCCARPVWLKGIGSDGFQDGSEKLWLASSNECKTNLNNFRVTTGVCNSIIRRYYNTGLIVFRRTLELASEWLYCYRALAGSSVVMNYLSMLPPSVFPDDTRPSFFIDQLAFAFALDRLNISSVGELNAKYNSPIHLMGPMIGDVVSELPIHIHYIRACY